MDDYGANKQANYENAIRTLWIGDLQYWMDESYIYNLFSGSCKLESVKVIRNKTTQTPEGYGFIEFGNREEAERVLRSYNGTMIPGTEVAFRLNWAQFGVGKGTGDDHSLFVGDLTEEVSDLQLQREF
eukprot:TRINITY_DN34915_c0_g1_i7.p3 TRINITY_DN34915_c0_g1~~TRINITY_DN34915_c0_g1_i7.p3  ORF type:complete len:145 (+),score=11.37 TRINITY_DN34915_c0_g1_i7:53-436(+)